MLLSEGVKERYCGASLSEQNEECCSSPTEEEGSVDPPEFTPGLKWEDTDSKTIQKFYSIFSTLEQEGLRGMTL